MVVVGRESGGDPVIEQKVFGTGRTGRAIPTVDDAVKPPSGSHYGLSLGILTADVAGQGFADRVPTGRAGQRPDRQ